LDDGTRRFRSIRHYPRLIMASTPPLDRLQKIADYRTTCTFLRRKGKSGIVLGCFFWFIGANAFQGRLFDYLYLGFATIELLVGLRNRLRPSAFGVVLDGGVLILLGVWNLTMQFLGWRLGTAIIDVVVICLGIRRIAGYPRARGVFRDPPTPEQIHWFDDLVAEIQSATAAETSDVIEFTSGIRWKGRRLGEIAVFVDKHDSENLIVDLRDIEILSNRKALLRSTRQVQLRVGRKTFALAEFSPEMLSLLESWLADDELAELLQTDEPEFRDN
jgi:hypothetical protein